MQRNMILDEELQPPEVTAIAATTTHFPDAEATQREMDRLQASSATYQAALQEVQSRNLQALDEDEIVPPFGWTTTDRSVHADEVQSLVFAATLGKDPDGNEVAIIGHVIRGMDENWQPIKDEEFDLITKPPGGITDPNDIKTVAAFRDGAKVAGDIQPFSLVSRLVKCVRSKCASACLGAITGCAGVFPVYLKCLVVACGVCAVKCGACATCKCRFWCKWAAGCCKD
jgi:hypothetical protein